MTVMFFVEEQTMRQRVPDGNIRDFPIAIAADGSFIENNDTEVAVLLIDDRAATKGADAVHLKLTAPVIAVLHRPNVPWQSSLLKQVGATSRGGFSHSDGNPSYEEVKALLSASKAEQRSSICQSICDSYGTEALLRKLEELAAWLSLPKLEGEEAEYADEVYSSLRKSLPKGANAKLKNADRFKELRDLELKDLENAAAVLIP